MVIVRVSKLRDTRYHVLTADIKSYGTRFKLSTIWDGEQQVVRVRCGPKMDFFPGNLLISQRNAGGVHFCHN